MVIHKDVAMNGEEVGVLILEVSKQPGLTSLLHHFTVYVTWTECFILAMPWLPHVLTKKLMYTSYRVAVMSKAGWICKWHETHSKYKPAIINVIMS